MRKSIWILGLSLVLLFILGLNIYAQPKEGLEPVTSTFYVTSKVLPLGEGRMAMTYEGIGLAIGDTGEGLFHNATVRVICYHRYNMTPLSPIYNSPL